MAMTPRKNDTDTAERDTRSRPRFSFGFGIPTIGTMAMFVFVQTVMFMLGITNAAAATGVCQVTSTIGSMVYGAQNVNWQKVTSGAMDHKVVTSLSQLKGGDALVNNRLGAAVARIPAKYLAGDTTFRSRHAAPIVMAIYDPQTSVGEIWVDRSIAMPNGDLLVEQLPFGPEDGVVMSTHYDHNNPFWQFVQGNNGNPNISKPHAFVKIGANAFFAAVGMVLKRFDAQRGLIATLKMRQVKHTHTSGGLFVKTTTVTLKDWASPRWTLVLPSGQAPGGYTSGYKLPICNPVTGAPLTAANASDAQAQASLWSGPATEGGASSALVNGQYWGALTIPSGVEYIDQGDKPVNLNTAEWLAYEHQKSQTGLGIISVFLITIILSVVTWGAAAAVAPALGRC